MSTHTDLIHRLIKELCRLPRCRALKRVTAQVFYEDGTPARVNWPPGQCDVWGTIWPQPYVTTHAVHFEIEVKRGKDRLREDQVKWQNACRENGVAHHVMHAKGVADEERAVREAVAFVRGLGGA